MSSKTRTPLGFRVRPGRVEILFSWSLLIQRRVAVPGGGRWRAPFTSAVCSPGPKRIPNSILESEQLLLPFHWRRGVMPPMLCLPFPCLLILSITYSGLPTPSCLKALFLFKSEEKLPSIKARLTPSAEIV